MDGTRTPQSHAEADAHYLPEWHEKALGLHGHIGRPQKNRGRTMENPDREHEDVAKEPKGNDDQKPKPEDGNDEDPSSEDEAEPEPKPMRAAQYVRMSTEHQQYSTENQSDVIREYAAKRGGEMVRTYADDGKSGLKIEGRASLKAMIDDVQTGNADFNTILVYDISRWGRFQDTDKSAYYEYLCKRAGIDVHYCAEQFENDGSPAATIIKSVKRVMAAEYSRELSSKVFKGQCKLIELGYRQGGPAGYGLRRMLIDHTHKEKGILARGEKKSLQTDRVILVRGPEEEVRIVQWIYQMFIREGRWEREIAEILNARGILTDLGRPWTSGTVHEVLTNEKYIGNNVYNRRSFKLKKTRLSTRPTCGSAARARSTRSSVPRTSTRPKASSLPASGGIRTKKCWSGFGLSWPSTTRFPPS